MMYQVEAVTSTRLKSGDTRYAQVGFEVSAQSRYGAARQAENILNDGRGRVALQVIAWPASHRAVARGCTCRGQKYDFHRQDCPNNGAVR